jgi:UDP-N-acetylmuramoyl-L-alanyl-D-glutamate--2,6-diaminopimelate ligase
MKLKTILKKISYSKIKGSKEIDITGVTSDSKRVFPGNIFIARKGKSFDGSEFIPQAISSGAKVIVTDFFNPFLKNVIQIIHPKPQEIEADIAANYYNFPSKKLCMIGVTGTNGKTTTTYIIKHILDGMKRSCGLIGNIEYNTGLQNQIATRTTPDCVTSQKLLREMVNNGCKACAMEVTSHSLDQQRVKHIDFDLAVFTNLTKDHLDYHKTQENYANAKQKLFISLNGSKKKKKVAIVNSDCPFSALMTDKSETKILRYAIDNNAEIKATNIVLSSDGTHFLVSYKNKQTKFFSPLIGRFNVSNLLAAISVGICLGFPIKLIADLIANFSQIPGRLEKIKTNKQWHIFIDYAHSDDALEKVLQSLMEIKKGRIITVFGCGGDRDKEKRPRMAAVSEKFSDLSIITNDNPRKEDPKEICRDIIKGFSSFKSYRVELDRKDAIALAMSSAKKNDIVLIAGKGHEKTQVFANQTIEFDDKKHIKKMCE